MRYFSAISLVLVVLAALAVGMYFRQTAAEDLKSVVEQNSISLTQGYTNTIWRRYKRLFTEILKDVPVSEWAKDKRFIRFSKDSFRYFEGIPVAKLNIYTADGERFLSTNQSEIILVKDGGGLLDGGQGSRGEAIQQVKDGKVFSRLIPEGGFKAPSGALTKGSLIQSFIPIMSDNYVPIVTNHSGPKIEAFVEVFYDVTPQWQQLDQFQVVGTAGIVGIFLVLIVALIYTAKKAEKIIAKQHEKNLELTSAKARAEAENREKSQFLANISHELRTPLNAIIGFSDIIKTQALGPVGHQQYIDYAGDINSSGSHLLSLINDILDYSKAEAGKLELEVSEVDATKLVKSCARLVQTRAGEAKVELIEKIPAEHFVLTTDAKKLKQILLNLLSNAVKFTPPGGNVTITAWENMQDDSYTIEVADTGIGIAPKDISKAMSPFGQVDSELSRKYEGTGLGLPLTKKFTEVMGGTFQIDSALNEGTTISITLPRYAPESAIKKAANTGQSEQSPSVTAPVEETSEEDEGAMAVAFGEGSFEAPTMPETPSETPSQEAGVATSPEEVGTAATVDDPFGAPSNEAPRAFEPEPQAPSTAETPDQGEAGNDPFAAPMPHTAATEEHATPEDLGFPAASPEYDAGNVENTSLNAPSDMQTAGHAEEDAPGAVATSPEDLGFPPAPEAPPGDSLAPAAPGLETLATEDIEKDNTVTAEDLGFPAPQAPASEMEAPAEAPQATDHPFMQEEQTALAPSEANKPEDLDFPPAPEASSEPLTTEGQHDMSSPELETPSADEMVAEGETTTPEDLGFPAPQAPESRLETPAETPQAMDNPFMQEEQPPAVPSEANTPEDLGFPQAPTPETAESVEEVAAPVASTEDTMSDVLPAHEGSSDTAAWEDEHTDDSGEETPISNDEQTTGGNARMDVSMGHFSVAEPAPASQNEPEENATTETSSQAFPSEPEASNPLPPVTPESIADDPALKPLNVPSSNPFADEPATSGPAEPEDMQNPFADALPETEDHGDDEDNAEDSPFELVQQDDKT